MATLRYVEVVDARTVIEAKDATYSVQFEAEYVSGAPWEFDSMSDATGPILTKKTNFMRVRFNPIEKTMIFPEDAKREMEYKLDIESARVLFKYIRKNNTQFWVALDLANQGRKHKLFEVISA